MEEVKKGCSSESIYMNIDDNQNEVHTNNMAALKPAASEGRKVCWGNLAAVCLGLLCVLLLVLTLSMWIKLGKERKELQSNYINMSMEREQLQSSYNHVISEREKIQKENNNLTSERNQLRTRYEVLKSERDAMQRELDGWCPFGWTKFKCSCYYTSQIKGTFDQSREDCRGRGADLVIINSEEEQLYVSGLRQNLWLGLTDRDFEGQWKWVDNTHLGAGYWQTGEPNNLGKGEHCAEVTAGVMFGQTLSRWNDIPCNYELFGLCEKKTCCKQ